MPDNANFWHFGSHFGFWQPSWKLKKIIFKKNRFLGLKNIHLDLLYCFLWHLKVKICKILDFGGHLGKMVNRKKCSTFGVWLQTDLDSAAQNLMETIIKVYICLKTRFSYQMLGCHPFMPGLHLLLHPIWFCHQKFKTNACTSLLPFLNSVAAALLLLQCCSCNALLQRGCCNATASTRLLQRGCCNAAAASKAAAQIRCCGW